MEIGDYQFPCTSDEYYDGIEDKCIPCANVCTKEPLTFCKNNCPEFYKKLTTQTHRAFADTSRTVTTFVDYLFSTSATTDPSPNDTSPYLSPTPVIPLTTLFALIAAVIAICIAIVAFILICKARRREKYDRKSQDTENPLLHRAESDSLCRSNCSTRSSSGHSVNAQNQNSKASPVCNYADPPDVARDTKAGGDEKNVGNYAHSVQQLQQQHQEEKSCVEDIRR